MKKLFAIICVVQLVGCATTQTNNTPAMTSQAKEYNAQLDKQMGVNSCTTYQCDYRHKPNNVDWQILNQRNQQLQNNGSSLFNKK